MDSYFVWVPSLDFLFSDLENTYCQSSSQSINLIIPFPHSKSFNDFSSELQYSNPQSFQTQNPLNEKIVNNLLDRKYDKRNVSTIVLDDLFSKIYAVHFDNQECNKIHHQF